jgi:hypothetical protein
MGPTSCRRTFKQDGKLNILATDSLPRRVTGASSARPQRKTAISKITDCHGSRLRNDDPRMELSQLQAPLTCMRTLYALRWSALFLDSRKGGIINRVNIRPASSCHFCTSPPGEEAPCRPQPSCHDHLVVGSPFAKWGVHLVKYGTFKASYCIHFTSYLFAPANKPKLDKKVGALRFETTRYPEFLNPPIPNS